MLRAAKVKEELSSIGYVPNTLMKARKVQVALLKSLFGNESTYSNRVLKKAYRKITGVKSHTNINFLIIDGYVYIIPESGLGLEQDLNNLHIILQIL